MLSEDFQETIIPMLAQSLMQFTSKDINPQLQALIDNIKNSGREWSRWIDDTDPRYTKLKKSLKEGKITNEEFAQKRDALTIEQLKEKQINNYKGLVVELTKAHTD